jgi:NADH:ubiquinone reductase (non-electrogenic)
MVVKVSGKEITTKEMKNGGEITTIPYGMAVWSTGIGTRPFIKDFMTQIGQVCFLENLTYTCFDS